MLVEALLFPGCLASITAMFLIFPEVVPEYWTFKFILGPVWVYAGSINIWVPMAAFCYLAGIGVFIWYCSKYVKDRRSNKKMEVVE
jgi:CBS domain containing-hemolysin-like protein